MASKETPIKDPDKYKEETSESHMRIRNRLTLPLVSQGYHDDHSMVNWFDRIKLAGQHHRRQVARILINRNGHDGD